MKYLLCVLTFLFCSSVFSQEPLNPPITNHMPLHYAIESANDFLDICSSSVVPPTTLNGVFITSTHTGSVSSYPTSFSSCSGAYTTPPNSLWLGLNGSFSYTLNFSQPINNLVIVITATGQAVDEEFTFTTNIGNPTITSSGSCYSRIIGNTILSGLNSPSNIGGGGGIFTISGSTPYTSMTITGPGGVAGSLVSLCSNSISTSTCNAGINPPALSATSLSAICPSTTVDLNNITATNTPLIAGVSLAWFTSSSPTGSNQLTTIQTASQLPGVTYYAAFFDSVNNCYSPSTPVTTTIAPNITPSFTQVNPICFGNTLSDLPTTSNNGITGTWSPPIDNTQTTTYTFTPANVCADITRMTIVVNPILTPTFTQVDPICYGSSILLPSISNNGISGTWLPTINNTETTTYTFNPNPDECAIQETMEVVVFEDFDFTIISKCENNDFLLEIVPTGNSLDVNSADYNWQINTVSVGNNSNTFNVTSYLNSTAVVESLPITFDVSVTNNTGCNKTKNITVNNIYCDIQNGISPNNDNLNDFFDLRLLEVKHLTIFNRYGIKTYDKENYTQEWIGQTNSGESLPTGTYYYLIEFKNNTALKTGWIYINRESK